MSPECLFLILQWKDALKKVNTGKPDISSLTPCSPVLGKSSSTWKRNKNKSRHETHNYRTAHYRTKPITPPFQYPQIGTVLRWRSGYIYPSFSVNRAGATVERNSEFMSGLLPWNGHLMETNIQVILGRGEWLQKHHLEHLELRKK